VETARTRAVFLVAALAAGCRTPPAAPLPANLLLLTLDTTRADRLGCYGYARPTTPRLDALARDGVAYTWALSTSSWTLPAHATLLTGRFEPSHGARYDPSGPLSLLDAVSGPRDWSGYRVRPLGQDEVTLAEVMRRAGYATAAVVAGPWLERAFGLDQGFDYYDDDRIDTANGRRAEDVTATALRWLERPRDGPFFVFLNYYDPHGPYSAPEPFGHAFLAPDARLTEGVPSGEELRARYDAEVLYMDHHLGRVLDGLRQRGLYDRTLVVVTADHGELLGEHGLIGHGQHLYQEELRVPLIVKAPRGEAGGTTDGSPVQLVDVMPIVLDRLGLPIPPGVQGGRPPRVGHPIVAEVDPPAFNSPEGEWRALFDGRLKLVWNGRGRHQLFDLRTDPGETTNLAGRDPERVRKLGSLLARYRDALPPPGRVGAVRPLDAETLRALRSLGYVN
jgi:arylsulfatase A-like enzyme